MIQIIGYILFTVIILVIVKRYLDKKGHPKGLFYLFFAEMWERFSFYGMRALLVLYLIKDFMSELENNEDIAYGIFASYGALVYLTPLIGGYLADKFIGYRKSIIFGGILMALGHFCMAFQNDIFFYGALGLLIIGNGFFKPNISTLVGSLYPEGDPKRDSGFTVFYMGINLGAMIAPLFCGYLGFEFGWHYGFGAAGIGMLAGLIVFWKGIKDGVLGDKGLQPVNYIGKKISGLKIEHIIYFCGFLSVPVFAYAILLNTQSKFLGNAIIAVGVIIFIYLSYIIYDLKINQKDKASGDRLIAVMIFCVFLTVFWACFEIAGSAVTVWADRCVNLFGINASQTNAINPAYIVLLAIPFSWVWTKLDISNKNPSTPIKFSLGILQLGLGFLVFAISFFYMGEDGKVPMIFLFLGYLLITTGELFLSPIGLSKVTQLAPKKIISFIMGVWFLSSTFAHHISGQIAKLTSKEFYSETNIITIKDGESQESYVFDMEFNFKNNIKGIKKITKYNTDKKEYSFVEEDKLLKKEKESYKIEKEKVNKLIIHKLLKQSEDKFWWDVNSDGLLILTLKSEKEVNKISNKNTEEVEDIITQLNEKIGDVELIPSLITSFYKTNESIKGNQDAIAGLRFLSDDIIQTDNDFNLNDLSPGLRSIKFTANTDVDFEFNYNIKEGPEDILSTYTYKLLGSPEIKNKTIATLLQYNTVYMKIGIVTILISLLVMLISPFLRKLMHGVK